VAHRLVPRLAAQRHVAADVRFVDLLAPGSREPVPLCARIIIRGPTRSTLVGRGGDAVTYRGGTSAGLSPLTAVACCLPAGLGGASVEARRTVDASLRQARGGPSWAVFVVFAELAEPWSSDR